VSNYRNKRLVLFLLVFPFISIIPLTSFSLHTISCSVTSYEAALHYDFFTAVQFADPFQTDYVLNWSYTISASYRHMVLLFTQENFAKVDCILTLDFHDKTAEYFVLSDSSSLHAEGSFPIPAVAKYVFVIYNNDSLCDFLHSVFVNYSVEVYDTIPDPPIAMIISLSIFGLMLLVVAGLVTWLRVKAKRLELADEKAPKAPHKPKTPKRMMRPTKSSSFRCAGCGVKIHALIDSCPHCHEPIPCSICKLTIKPTDTLSKCPYCGCIGHSEHFLEWLHVNAKCPKCQVKLEATGLQILQLKKLPDKE